MEKILLVEPNYKNKYPPIGLMKISTYFKRRNDYVEFHKGLMPQSEASEFDKIFVTTLFTFDFQMCIQTIQYYIGIVGINNVYVGGIAATIMPEKFNEFIPGIQILKGQLTSSNILGYDDDVNIDILELDYDILWDVPYDYPAADSYFIYTSRGCPRKCSFCAVKTLEPNFYNCNNIVNQVNSVNENFGIKRNLLIMDNNILYSNKFNDIVNDLIELGFGNKNNRIKKCNNMKYYLNSLEFRRKNGYKQVYLLRRIIKEVFNIKYSRVNKIDTEKLDEICKKIKALKDDALVDFIISNKDYLIDFFERYNYHLISRHIDFNQGLDARLLTKEKAEKMAQLALKPCRIAFDSIAMQDTYLKAMENAVEAGIKHFSNYLLYNYDEKPESLWRRLKINIEFCKKHESKKISLFSFPMKYSAIDRIDRNYIGKYWHKKYLRAINVILNVTSGVVTKEEDFFLHAYGNTEEEFLEILIMPDDFIRHREFYENNGYTQLWKKYFHKLNDDQRKRLIDILDDAINKEIENYNEDDIINRILFFYTINKKRVEANELFYKLKFDKLTQFVKSI